MNEAALNKYGTSDNVVKSMGFLKQKIMDRYTFKAPKYPELLFDKFNIENLYVSYYEEQYQIQYPGCDPYEFREYKIQDDCQSSDGDTALLQSTISSLSEFSCFSGQYDKISDINFINTTLLVKNEYFGLLPGDLEPGTNNFIMRKISSRLKATNVQ